MKTPRGPFPRSLVALFLLLVAIGTWRALTPAPPPAASASPTTANPAAAVNAAADPSTDPSAPPATLTTPAPQSPIAPTVAASLSSRPVPTPPPGAGPRRVPPSPPVDYRTHYVLIDGQKAHPTRLLARFKPDAAPADRRDALEPHELGILDEFDITPGAVVLDTTGVRPGPVVDEDDARSRGEIVLDRIKALLKSDRFLYVEPDYILQASLVPTDSSFTDGTLWGLRNTGQNSGVAGADIDAVRAWDITTGSTNVIVAVIDSGIRYTHTDLAAQMWRNPGEIPGNGIDDDGDGYIDNVFGINAAGNSGDPNDDNDHGTHCAGTIGAAANSGGRHVGVAWRVRLMALKFLNAQGSGATSDSIKCINFAARHGAHIINASYGGGGFSQAVFDSITAARNASVLFVAAAGNESSNNDSTPAFPANYNIDNIISVAAIDRQDKLANFSNFGATRVHLGAPGVSILSSARGSNTEYKTFDGTSMAAPHVAGVAALVLAQHPNTSLASLRQRLLGSVVRTDALRGRTITGGRVNARAALLVAPDDRLELDITPPEGTRLTGGTTVGFVARVTDLDPVLNATVNAQLPTGGNVVFRNDGVSPDQTANDGFYSANVVVPSNTNRFTLTVIANAPGKVGITNQVSFPVILPITNDAFANRTPITGLSASITSHNTGATLETSEPRHAGQPGGRSVWWSWTAPANGTATLSTSGSDFDTVLAVYTGNSLGNLQVIASDDDSGPGTTSSVTFSANSGVTYQIAVDGYAGAQGIIQLNLGVAGVANPPPNDNFASRTTLSGAVVGINASNLAATRENGEPNHAGNPGGRSVWWSWTAPLTGIATVHTDTSSFNTLLAIYTGSTINALSTVISDDDGGEGDRSRVVFPVTEGTTYQIAVDGFSGAQGNIALSITAIVPPPPPQNDFFTQRVVLSGTEVTALGDTRTATRESGEPDHAGNSGGGSIWWSWTAPRAGRLTLTTAGSDFDTLLATYTGSSIAALTPIAANDDDPNGGSTSRITFDVASGITYHIAVDGRNTGLAWATGNVVLNLSLGDLLTGPPNDAFANPSPISGSTATLNGSNVGATAEPGEPNHVGAFGGRSVWWSWTAPANGLATFDTSGSTFDTVLAAYVGSAVSGLTVIAADDDGGTGTTSRMTFNAIAGTNYRIAIDGFLGATGGIVLRLTQVPAPPGPANDNFANPNLINPSGGIINASNLNATREPGEPSHAGAPGGGSVWWSWTPSSSGVASIATTDSNFDTLLAVYIGSSLANLSLVAASDDDAFSFTSSVNFRAEADTTYRIAVDGYAGASGNIRLTVVPNAPINVPANDDFAGRTRIPSVGGIFDTSNAGASREASEPAHAGNTASRSLWWTWTAPSTGTVTLSTADSTIDTVLATYTGATLGNLTLIRQNDDGPTDFSSKLTFNAIAGTTYHIAVDGFAGESGPIRLSLLFTPPTEVQPDAFEPDDSFAAARPVTNGVTQLRSIHRAGDVDWVQFTLTGSRADVLIDTDGPAGDTVIEVFRAANPGTVWDSDDDGGNGAFARLQMIDLAPGTYYVRISDFGNDSPIPSYSLRISWQNALVPGTADRYEPDNTFSDAKTIGNGEIQSRSIHALNNQDWARFTLASTATNVRIETDGPSGDTELWLYGPDSVATTIGYDDDGGFDLFSRIFVPTLAPGTYYIRVRAFGSSLIPFFVLRASWTESLPALPPTPIPPDLAASLSPDGSRISLRITGSVGQTYRIETLDTLDSTQWSAAASITLTQPTQDWTDPINPSSSTRFYRAVNAP